MSAAGARGGAHGESRTARSEQADARGEPSIVLAVEVSQREGGVAIGRATEGRSASFASTDSAKILEVTVGPPDRDRDRLMPSIDEAFRLAGAAPHELRAIIVSIGPGGFTGLRMAVATAKALSLATGCALVAIPSAVVAMRSWVQSAGAGEFTALVALSGKGADAWVSHVCAAPDGADGSIVEHSAGIVDAEGFERLIASAREHANSKSRAQSQSHSNAAPLLICDEHLPAALGLVADRHQLVRAPLRPTARACWEEGMRALAQGLTISPDDLLPLYPREPEAIRLWRERHGQ